MNNFAYSLAQKDKDLENALKMAEKAIEQEPENGAFLDTIGWVFFKLEKYDKAIEYIEKSLTYREGSAEVYEHLGDVYQKLGEPEIAHKHWQQAKELEPDRQSVLLKLGIN